MCPNVVDFNLGVFLVQILFNCNFTFLKYFRKLTFRLQNLHNYNLVIRKVLYFFNFKIIIINNSQDVDEVDSELCFGFPSILTNAGLL